MGVVGTPLILIFLSSFLASFLLFRGGGGVVFQLRFRGWDDLTTEKKKYV
jgi:hypothetical protein